MGVGLEHLFAGIAGGVGSSMLARQKEERDRTEREQMAQLAHLTDLIKDPNLTPEARAELFKSAMGVATFGDKKLAEQINQGIGGLLTQTAPHQSGPHQQTAPVGDTATEEQAPSLPPSGMSKFGQGQQQRIFQTPQEQTDIMAQRAGAVAGAQANAELPARKELQTQQSTEALSNAKALQENEALLQARNGFHPIGVTPKDSQGNVRTLYVNGAGQQITGAPVPDFTTIEAKTAGDATKMKADIEQAVSEDGMLRAAGIDPKAATAQQRFTAGKRLADLQLAATKAGIDHTKAATLGELVKAQIAMQGGNSSGLTDAQAEIDYNRQVKEYDSRAAAIDKAVGEVNKAKEDAAQAQEQAAVIEHQLSSLGYTRADEPTLAKMGLPTWTTRDVLMATRKTILDQARNRAKAAFARFKGDVSIGNDPEWPHLENNMPEFQYVFRRTLPGMPEKRGAKGSKGFVDVPQNILDLTKP